MRNVTVLKNPMKSRFCRLSCAFALPNPKGELTTKVHTTPPRNVLCDTILKSLDLF
jgi:hypothetical protein